ncbi:MAG: hypothetical protein Tsb0020_39530 [Haliangiales bacterium]
MGTREHGNTQAGIDSDESRGANDDPGIRDDLTGLTDAQGFTVQEGSVGASQVTDMDLAVVPSEFKMDSRDEQVIELDAAVRVDANGQARLLALEESERAEVVQQASNTLPETDDR